LQPKWLGVGVLNDPGFFKEIALDEIFEIQQSSVSWWAIP
jgi:hypothetical protein